MSAWLGMLVAAALGVPHRLALDRVPPVAGAAIWLCALALRALVAAFAVVWFVIYAPATELFAALTHWCWHSVLPLLSSHLLVDGHVVGDAAVLAPTAAVAWSVVAVGVGLARATLAVRRWVAGAARPGGPQGSLIVGDGGVLVAAAGLIRPRVVVSAGALLALDDRELAASVEHERGHIARHHRFVLLASELCRALARFLPGTRRATAELRHHLERDADAWALARHPDRVALARAICKAAGALPSPSLAALGGGSATRRVGQLLHQPTSSPSAWERLAAVLTVGMLALVLVLLALGLATVAQLDVGAALPRHCVD
ncbi:MAG TPA: M56 family metallopeptidase [Solirubrobacteraceae bacterium]|nr:M56 family metallopeptidase [Solirubrobacteraceae bacterium]